MNRQTVRTCGHDARIVTHSDGHGVVFKIQTTKFMPSKVLFIDVPAARRVDGASSRSAGIETGPFVERPEITIANAGDVFSCL